MWPLAQWESAGAFRSVNGRRLFVVDRGHQRMQVFDVNGKFLDMFTLRSPHWPANQAL